MRLHAHAHTDLFLQWSIGFLLRFTGSAEHHDDIREQTVLKTMHVAKQRGCVRRSISRVNVVSLKRVYSSEQHPSSKNHLIVIMSFFFSFSQDKLGFLVSVSQHVRKLESQHLTASQNILTSVSWITVTFLHWMWIQEAALWLQTLSPPRNWVYRYITWTSSLITWYTDVHWSKML